MTPSWHGVIFTIKKGGEIQIMTAPRGYEPAEMVTPKEINMPLQNESVPSPVPPVNEMGGEIRGPFQDPADPKK